MNKDKQFNLYADDFEIKEWWKQVCNDLDVDYKKADKVTIFFNKVIVNKQMLINYNPYIWYSSPYSQTFNLRMTAIITLTLWKIAYNIFFITGLL